MTRPKKWYMDSDNGGTSTMLYYSDGELVKKPNANQSLGYIKSVSVQSENVQVSLITITLAKVIASHYCTYN